MTLCENAQKVLQKRYYAPGETWPRLCLRVASHVAATEEKNVKQWTREYTVLLEQLDFLPNSPVLRNFGRNRGCGSACFVLPIEDSRRGIMATLADAVDVQAFGGGTGFAFSRLRPKGDPVRSTGGAASGPVSFMAMYDHAIGSVIRQGGVRPGANMGVLRVDHPDIEEFVGCKRQEGRFSHFNISVGCTDAFMRAVCKDRPFKLTFGGKLYRTLPARQLWRKIIGCAWTNGEPGMVFLDTINRDNPLKALGEIEATNPCGEEPLIPYGSCTLGSVNLAQMVTSDWVAGEARLDEEKLKKVVRLATRFLDAVVSANHYPVEKIREVAENTRQIGIGVMGFADLCIKLKMRYGHRQSIDLARWVMRIIYAEAKATSEALGKEKGICAALKNSQQPRRNALLTSIAPTGTLSLIADCAGGCEPHFAFNYRKGCLDGQALGLVPKVLHQWVKANGAKAKLPAFFVTAAEVSVDEHIAMLAAFQNSGVDAGVSKTVNMPENATLKEVSRAFMQAWQSGVKGMTVYRDGSRNVQALTVSGAKTAAENDLNRGVVKHRPRTTIGPKVKVQTACGALYIDTNFDGEGLIEVFQRTVAGGCEANAKALGVLASYTLRLGLAPQRLIDALKKIRCPACERALAKGGSPVEVRSCADGMARAMAAALASETVFRQAAAVVTDRSVTRYLPGVRSSGRTSAKPCPDCGAPLRPDAGCFLCAACGFSKC